MSGKRTISQNASHRTLVYFHSRLYRRQSFVLVPFAPVFGKQKLSNLWIVKVIVLFSFFSFFSSTEHYHYDKQDQSCKWTNSHITMRRNWSAYTVCQLVQGWSTIAEFHCHFLLNSQYHIDESRELCLQSNQPIWISFTHDCCEHLEGGSKKKRCFEPK